VKDFIPAIGRRAELLFLSLLCAISLAGCQTNQAVPSADYQKLPPGEGARRLKDTLKRRAAGQALAHPLPPNVSVGSQ
jgi:hypothetical protein